MDDSVLLIEGDDVIRRHLAALVAESGHPCHSVPDLRAGLHELRQRPYRFVVLDLDLPEARSTEAVRRLRLARPDSCLIGLDSAAEKDARFSEAPFDAIIPKPFVLDHLLEVLAAGGAGPVLH
jgi:DNA-binding response OmpR family regulator